MASRPRCCSTTSSPTLAWPTIALRTANDTRLKTLSELHVLPRPKINMTGLQSFSFETVSYAAVIGGPPH